MKFFNGRELVPLILGVGAILLGALLSPNFFDVRFLYNHTSLFIETGLLALGMTFVILLGQIDLSVGSMLGLVSCVSGIALKSGMSLLLVIPLALGLGVALGSLNGVLIAGLGLPSFVVTLGTLAAYRGLAEIAMRSKSVPFPMLALMKIPASAETAFLFTFLSAAFVLAIILHRTVFGRWVVSIGSNPAASLYSGLPLKRVTIAVFAMSGLLSGIAALVLNLRLGLARQDHGVGFELDAITAVVLGGASIYGGTGTMAGTLAALMLLGIVHTEMGVANVVPEYQLAVIGALLVLSVVAGNGVNRLLANISERRKSPA